jgi:3'(2'), 5'-bisphosphate nucleotidase
MDIEDLKEIALKAGEAIMQIYNKDFSVDYKDDKSPLTEADLKSNEIICANPSC